MPLGVRTTARRRPPAAIMRSLPSGKSASGPIFTTVPEIGLPEAARVARSVMRWIVIVKVNFKSSALACGMAEARWTIGEVAGRAGVRASALRFYEDVGLLSSVRTESGQRRFTSDVVRRVAFIRVAQRVGLSLEEIAEALAGLPQQR